MQDPQDPGTVDASPMPRRRGRPVTGNAKSNAERQSSYRARKRAEGLIVKTVYMRPADGFHADVALVNAESRCAELERSEKAAWDEVDRLKVYMADLEVEVIRLQEAKTKPASNRLMATIKKTSKYYGQAGCGRDQKPFFVIRDENLGDGFCYRGGVGGQYRETDLQLWLLAPDGRLWKLA